jgi:hypothetical protein
MAKVITGEKWQSLKQRLIDFVKERQSAGKDSPTFKETARRFKVNYDQVEDLISDCSECLDTIVGIRVGGSVGGAIGVFETRGEYQIEYFGD